MYLIGGFKCTLLKCSYWCSFKYPYKCIPILEDSFIYLVSFFSSEGDYPSNAFSNGFFRNNSKGTNMATSLKMTGGEEGRKEGQYLVKGLKRAITGKGSQIVW